MASGSSIGSIGGGAIGTAAFGPVGGLAGSAIGGLIGGLFDKGPDKAAFGEKPKVAPYVPVDLADETGKAVAGNAENADSITSFLNKIIPGFSDILGQGLDNTFSELQGHLPQDVRDEVYRSSAFQSLMGGFGGTPMGKALTARDLGLTSLNLTQLGNNSAQLWTQIAESAYSPWLVGTSESAAVTAANNAGKQATDQLQFNIDAAPDPETLGLLNYNTAKDEQQLGIASAFAGNIAGKTSGVPVPGYSYNSLTGKYTSTGSGSTDWRANASPWG